MPYVELLQRDATAVRGMPRTQRRVERPRTSSGRCADPLTGLCFDAWLLAAHARPGDGALPDGRAWERGVAKLLGAGGFDRHQGPGSTTLLGTRSMSGARHELDGTGRISTGGLLVILESKAVTELSKLEVVTFYDKVWDFYLNRLPTEAAAAWHPVLVSAAPVSDTLRRIAITKGVIIVDPTRLPLPYLLDIASRPTADAQLPEILLAECVRLVQRAVVTVQQRWPLGTDGRVAFDPSWWPETALKDLLFVQDELSTAVLDLYDTQRPGVLETRAADLVDHLKRIA